VIIDWIRFWSIKMVCPGEFPGGALVKTWAFTAVDSDSTLVRELRSHKPCSAAKHTHTHTHTHLRGELLWFSHVQLFETPWTAALQASLSFTISLSLLKLMSTESVMPSNYLILCYPLLLLPSIRGEGWDESGNWDWHIYAIDTMYRVLIRTYCIAQGIPTQCSLVT